MATISRLKKLCKRKRSSRAPEDTSEVATKDRERKTKKRRTSRDGQAPSCEPEDEKIADFVRWCSEVGIELHPRLYIGRRGSCADVGVVAGGDIASGECLALIPREALLTCANSRVNEAVGRDREFQKKLPAISSWVPLLLAMLAEYDQKAHSKWHPYLSLVPNNEHAGPPMLWGGCERERLLEGTGVRERVESDLQRIGEDFHTIVLPFMQRHSQLFRKSLHSLQLYEKLVATVMSYSFTDDEEGDALQRTMMVPFVDLLNHHSLHHAELNFGEDHLQLMAVRRISTGEEIMNTYGPLPNASLLHIYGFAEPRNPHDVAYISQGTIKHLYVRGKPGTLSRRERRWQQLETEELLEERYEVTCKGQPDERLLALVKLLHVKEKIFQRKKEQLLGYWSNSSSDSEGCAQSHGQCVSLANMRHKGLEFLRRLASHCLKQFPESYDSNLQTAASGQLLSDRERFSLYLCIGQQKCLLSLLEHLDSS